ncbi:MAG TPA: HAD-IIB family hydrolase [Rhizomicrobium sp.]|nr:HAD-IIB family hydrolase [Rhizomicrobium sp.]
MQDLASAPRDAFRGVRFVLTDMDDTLTHEGRLSGATYAALEKLHDMAFRVIVVTAAPAGWCDQMARMWPIDGVIGENGGFIFRRGENRGLLRDFWHGADQRAELREIGDRIRARVPDATLADDQPFRLSSIAFARPENPNTRAAILAAMREAGLRATENNLWVLGWLGDFDKLAMTRRVLTDVADDEICYTGDSENDAPMFRTFRHTIGMSTVRDQALSSYPRWITRSPGGAGFVEAAEAVLASNSARASGRADR